MKSEISKDFAGSSKHRFAFFGIVAIAVVAFPLAIVSWQKMVDISPQQQQTLVQLQDKLQSNTPVHAGIPVASQMRDLMKKKKGAVEIEKLDERYSNLAFDRDHMELYYVESISRNDQVSKSSLRYISVSEDDVVGAAGLVSGLSIEKVELIDDSLELTILIDKDAGAHLSQELNLLPGKRYKRTIALGDVRKKDVDRINPADLSDFDQYALVQ